MAYRSANLKGHMLAAETLRAVLFFVPATANTSSLNSNNSSDNNRHF
jgi:hypothetical protein